MLPGNHQAPAQLPAETLDTRLPDGWYCRAVSAGGYGVFTKRVRRTLSTALDGRTWSETTDYRVIYNGFMGGWVVDKRLGDGDYLFNGMPFATHLAAIVAVEIELAQQEAT